MAFGGLNFKRTFMFKLDLDPKRLQQTEECLFSDAVRINLLCSMLI